MFVFHSLIQLILFTEHVILKHFFDQIVENVNILRKNDQYYN